MFIQPPILNPDTGLKMYAKSLKKKKNRHRFQEAMQQRYCFQLHRFVKTVTK